MAYIYQITNDINGKIYVGKTEFSIEKRFQEHCQDSSKERNEKRPLYAAMRKYGIEHFHVSLLEETNNPEERECYWIEQLRSFKNGYNATCGGDGKKYLDYDLIIATFKQVKSLNKTAELVGCHVDSVATIIKNNNLTNLINRHQTGTTVHQYSKTGEYIQTFPSAKSAAEACGKITKEHPSKGAANHILQVCKGKRKTAYGYKWSFDK